MARVSNPRMALAWPFFLVSGALAANGPSFVTLGDWGGAALDAQHKADAVAVAEQMASTASSSSAQFVVNVGDNFYYCGIQNTSDPQIKTDFTEVYGQYSSLQIPWYSILGNHEYGYNVDAQIAYSKVNKHWIMPDRYYTKRVQIATSGQFISFIFLDSSPCVSAYRSSDPSGWDPCGSEFPTCSPVIEGPCKFHQNILGQQCGPQLAWLKTTLAAVPKEDWLILVGHHPLDELDVADFTSVVMSHGFDLYLNGHVHALQQYAIQGNSAFVTSGAGSMVDTSDQKEERGANSTMMWNQKVAGFTQHTFSEDLSKLTTEYISSEGQVVHSFTVTKGVAPPPPSTGSCRNIGCGEYKEGAPCGCNSKCGYYKDCCPDFEQTCGGSCSAIGCFSPYKYGQPCQCTKDCDDYHNCCPDFYTLCGKESEDVSVV